MVVATLGVSASLTAPGALLLEDDKAKGAVLEDGALRAGASYCDDRAVSGAMIANGDIRIDITEGSQIEHTRGRNSQASHLET